MRAVSRRQKLLLGALGIVATAWFADSLSGGGKTAVAKAASTGASESVPTEADAPAGSDVAELLVSLSAEPQPAAPLDPDRLGRDLFVPTVVLQSACKALNTNAAVTGAQAEKAPAAEDTPLDQRHELQGVLSGGRVPLAIIDGQLFKTGSKLDGYTVVGIERDHVVCERGGQRVVLTLSDRGQ